MAVGQGVSLEAPDELLSFEPSASGDGLEVADHIERRHVTIETTTPVTPTDVDTDRFEFPVGRGVAIDTDGLRFPSVMGVYVRNSMGFMVADLTSGEEQAFPHDRYSIEVPAPIKLYLVVEGSPRIEVSDDGIAVDLGTRSTVHVGARSHHKLPAASITVGDGPRDLMAAVSTFSSALKTTSCERSYPTLRGHPPTIRFGDELAIPDVLQTPDTGVTIQVPPDYRSVFLVSTLAYYLGADVVPGDDPRIVTDRGFAHELDAGGAGFETGVEQALKQVFFLDCLVRTEGFYQVDLHERNVLEGALDLDIPSLYDAPLPEQLETYLDVPYATVEPYLPAWRLTAHVDPSRENAEALPFVVNDLAVLRTPSTVGVDDRGDSSLTVDDFLRSSTARTVVESAPTPDLVRVEESDAMEQTWIGEGVPIGASKGMIQAFRNRLNRQPADGDIDITVVCNAPEMDQERNLVDEVYGTREELPFDVDVRRELTRSELREILGSETEFLHYIGHIDAAGFECTDGRLDAATLDHVAVDVFFLNACTSYQQGMQLIENGSTAGIVTLQDVINSGAERIGYTLARLLNSGFPLRAALNLAKTRSIMGGHYLVIGDGGVDVVQAEHGTPILFDVDRTRSTNRVDIEAFPTQKRGMGTIFYPAVEGVDEHFLAAGRTCSVDLDDGALLEYHQMGDAPMLLDGELCWREEADFE